MRWGLVFCALLPACDPNATGSGSGAISLHDLNVANTSTGRSPPSLTDDYYALPFPNDLRIGADGTIDLTKFPRLEGVLGDYVNAFDAGLRGFGLNSAIYFRFDAAIDSATLPADGNASIAAGASAFLVDVSPDSPTYGQRTPVLTHFVAQAYDYIGPNWVALLPFPGFSLRESTTYAAILTDDLKAADGGPVRPAPYLKSVLDGNPSTDPLVTAAQQKYAPLMTWLPTQSALLDHIVNVTVFTTLDATTILTKARDVILDTVTQPALTGLAYLQEDISTNADIYTGSYMSPNFQKGDPPYSSTGGNIELGPNGLPKVQRMESMRVAMSIPKGTMPVDGWPVVIYAHGTGGDYLSFTSDRSSGDAANVTNAAGSTISKLAMISIDQVLHGPRDPSGSSPETNFFNFGNIIAARDNPKQGAIDDFQLIRLVKQIEVASAPMTGAPIRFDASRIYFKGHSQGGLTGSLFIAAEREIRASVLSGAGGGLMFSLLHKTKPVDITAILGGLLRDPADEYHPLLGLAQSFFDEADPLNYARHFFRDTTAPRSIFLSMGLVDNYTPVPSIKALALAAGLQPAGNMLEPIEGLDLAGLSFTAPPVVDNVANSTATGVVVQYRAAGTADGHFVLSQLSDGRKQSNRFLATHAATGKARLDPP